MELEKISCAPKESRTLSSSATLQAIVRIFYSHYGDPEANLPDGPERIRDLWKRIRDLFDQEGVTNITWAAQSPSSVGAPAPDHEIVFRDANNWDRMEYYWPGRNYLDWGGVSAYINDLTGSETTPGSFINVTTFWLEQIEGTGWEELPNTLFELSQIPDFQKEKPGFFSFLDWMKFITVALPQTAEFRRTKAKSVHWIPRNMPMSDEEYGSVSGVGV